ncbi:Uncharacterised protein [Sporosarcina pasteurii]|uniref:Uncharacterized protein n=1 Tax=Sporosarcina pasteurii TaxID=1474 RepID=A0A380C0B7_SPOPA|nr:Uncharacterised protein [Sporosarcina pasteurii]
MFLSSSFLFIQVYVIELPLFIVLFYGLLCELFPLSYSNSHTIVC